MINILLALHPVEICIIVLVAAAFTAVIIASFILTRRRRRGSGQAEKSPREAMVEFDDAIAAIMKLAEGKPEIARRTEALHARLKVFTPSDDEDVAALDEKIKRVLGEIKAELTKTKCGEGSGRAESYILEAEALIAERAALTER